MGCFTAFARTIIQNGKNISTFVEVFIRKGKNERYFENKTKHRFCMTFETLL